MVHQTLAEMEEFLRPTELCDSKNSVISEKAEKIVKDAKTPKEAAVRVFEFVRDQIQFALVYPLGVKASDTLREGIGQCATKTNLQVALLRSVGIPAKYHVAVVDKDCLKGVISPFMYRLFPDRVWGHPWCECYLSDEWIACEALFDKALYDAACRRGIVSAKKIPTIDWGGEQNLNTMEPWVLEDLGTFGSFEAIAERVPKGAIPPKFLANLIFPFSNRHTNKVRNL